MQAFETQRRFEAMVVVDEADIFFVFEGFRVVVEVASEDAGEEAVLVFAVNVKGVVLLEDMTLVVRSSARDLEFVWKQMIGGETRKAGQTGRRSTDLF